MGYGSDSGSQDGRNEDYDEKAEDAVDYEDIDEQYEGPEVQAASEEDYLLPKKAYLSSSLTSLKPTASVFANENYDEEIEEEHEVVENDGEAQTTILSVSKKEAPDYLDIIDRPMDLSTVKEKVGKMEYKSREQFRHDVWQIACNAHRYNDGRNPGIPPLADQLSELCDYILNENDESLTEAKGGIESRDF